MNPRIQKLHIDLEKNNLEAILVTQPANVSYLSGFKISDSCLLISQKQNFFITDFRFLDEAKKIVKDFSFLKINSSFFKTISNLSAKLKIKSLGFEAKHINFAEYEKIHEYLNHDIKFLPTYDLIENQRQIKGPLEIEKIRKAVDIAIQAFDYIKKILKPGLREITLAAELERFVRLHGAQGSAFEIIVASGINSTFAHAKPSDTIINNQTPVIIDLGVDFQGYKSDLTRTFFLGKITPIFEKTYDAVLRAQKTAIDNIKPGIKIAKIDDVARGSIIKKLGKDYLGHSLGHGVGLEVHEDPTISSKNKYILKEGMVFTVEPAAYLPDRFGIRIEDMVLVTKGGCEVLSGDLDKSI